MTDSDDKLSRLYREAAREEPSSELDASILAASRRAVSARPGRSNWMVPASIAAVLMLGIGVSLRMQTEKPGIETSLPEPPARPPAAIAEPAPAKRQDAEPKPAEPATEAGTAKPRARAAEVAKPLAKEGVVPESKVLARNQAASEEKERAAGGGAARKDGAQPEPFSDAPIAMQAPVPVSPPSVALSVPAAPATTPSAPAAAPAAAAPAPAPAARAESTTAPMAAAAPPMQSVAPRAKREAFAADSAARESRAPGVTVAADPDPARELERIARLRESGRNEEADRALAEFRRRHPGYKISEPMWERVKPR